MPIISEEQNVTMVARALLATGRHNDSEAALALLAIQEALRHATREYRGRRWVVVDHDLFYIDLPFHHEAKATAVLYRLVTYKLIDLRSTTEEVDGFPDEPYTYTWATLTAKGRKAMRPRNWGQHFRGNRRENAEASA